jgi:uncharacterized protein
MLTQTIKYIMKDLTLFSMAIGIVTIIISAIMPACNPGVSPSADYPIKPVPFTDVKVKDDFWAKRLLTNHQVTIPIAFKKAEETGRIDNFRIAGKLKEGKFSSLYPFDDSDVYKNIEAASYSIQIFPDPKLEAYLDTLIGYIAAAQEDDGYLYTNRTIDPQNTYEMAGKERWINEEESSHELYNAGHLYEAAVAHYQATGKRTLLDVALINANLIDSLFGWGKIEKAPGHQEIEIGLVKLFRVTGDKKYLDLAKFFLEVRGPGKDRYNQMHKKVLEQDSAVGHAVRAQYMYAAMADIAALTGNKDYLAAIDKLWADVVQSKTYITGGIGSVRDIEGFGAPYSLPNMEAYCETCAAIANCLWNYRMFLLHGDSKYFDVFEKVLYNGLLSGVSLSGDHFFYPNPLASSGQYTRKAWFGCACCPVNITRFLPSLPGYIYAVDRDNLYVNLFIGNEADIQIGGQPLHLVQVTNYPWDGEVKLTVRCQEPMSFKLMVRVPGWAGNQAFSTDLYRFEDKNEQKSEFMVNGKLIDADFRNGYAVIYKTWKDGDQLQVKFPMIPRKVRANPLVKEDDGKIALQRGPVIYCFEADQSMPFVSNLVLADSDIHYEFKAELLNGVGILSGKVLYREIGEERKVASGPESDFYTIPYYAWANRCPAEMTVWISEAQHP